MNFLNLDAHSGNDEFCINGVNNGALNMNRW